MAELINPDNYQDFTLEMLKTPDGITKLNVILRQLANNISGDTESVRVYSGVGTPEASVAAGVGSLYMRTDGGADTSVYRKESGSADTGWVAIKAPASLPLSVANGGTGVDFSSGTSGNYLYFSSTGVIGQTSLSVHNSQTFNSSGTFTAPSSTYIIWVSMIGGGGGGGSARGGNNIAGGGGAGAYLYRYPYIVTPGNNYTVTIGAGGAAGVTGGDGGNGGATLFDTLNCNGGSGGKGDTNGGTFGAAGTVNATPNYDANLGTGGNGLTALGLGPSQLAGKGGTYTGGTSGGGGGSPFGAGVNGVSGNSVGNSATANTGTGGGGSSATPLPGGQYTNGGVGGSGVVIVYY